MIDWNMLGAIVFAITPGCIVIAFALHGMGKWWKWDAWKPLFSLKEWEEVLGIIRKINIQQEIEILCDRMDAWNDRMTRRYSVEDEDGD